MIARTQRRKVRQSDIDVDTVDRILDGRVAPDDAPQAFGQVTALLQTARGTAQTPRAAEGADSDLNVPVSVSAESAGIGSRRQRRTSTLIAIVLCVAGAIGAGAATGVLHRGTEQPITSTNDHGPGQAVTTTGPAATEPTSIPAPALTTALESPTSTIIPPAVAVTATTLVKPSSPGAVTPTHRPTTTLGVARTEPVVVTTVPPPAPATTAGSPGKSGEAPGHGAALPPGQAKKVTSTTTATIEPDDD
jgi:hypothetical protein